MTTAAGSAFAATHRVRHRSLGDAADVRAPALPAIASGLANRDVRVVEVADLADRRAALEMDLANLPRGEDENGVIALFRRELDERARGAGELAALPREQLDVVNLEADRN